MGLGILRDIHIFKPYLPQAELDHCQVENGARYG